MSSTVLTDFEKDVINYNPFDGDFGGPGDRQLRDTVTISRKKGTCSNCSEQFHKGSMIRIIVMLYAGEPPKTYRYCKPCCYASALSHYDNGEAITERCSRSLAGAR